MGVAVEDGKDSEAEGTEDEEEKKEEKRKVLEWPRPVVVGDLEELGRVGFWFRWRAILWLGEEGVGGGGGGVIEGYGFVGFLRATHHKQDRERRRN